MDKFKLSGVVKNITEVKEGTTKKGEPFKSLTIVVEQVGVQYPNTVALDYYKQGDNVKFIDGFKAKVGDAVDVEFNSSSNEYNGRFYNRLNLWSINIVSSSAPVAVEDDELGLPF